MLNWRNWVQISYKRNLEWAHLNKPMYRLKEIDNNFVTDAAC